MVFAGLVRDGLKNDIGFFYFLSFIFRFEYSIKSSIAVNPALMNFFIKTTTLNPTSPIPNPTIFNAFFVLV